MAVLPERTELTDSPLELLLPETTLPIDERLLAVFALLYLISDEEFCGLLVKEEEEEPELPELTFEPLV